MDVRWLWLGRDGARLSRRLGVLGVGWAADATARATGSDFVEHPAWHGSASMAESTASVGRMGESYNYTVGGTYRTAQ